MKAVSVITLLGVFVPDVVLMAQAGPDWRLVGGTPDTYLFYDTQSLRKLADGHLQVWLKALPAKRTEKASEKIADQKEHLEHVYQKIKAGYVPPLGLTHKLTKTGVLNGVIDEEVANAASIDPVVRMLLEIDCSNAMSRRLSFWMNQGGKSASSEEITQWQHIAPETNFATLRLAICSTT